jgi:hypothetical protein
MNPENTTERDPLLHMVGMLSDGQTKYITDMEAAGQRQLVHSDVLPKVSDDAPFLALGFSFGEDVDDLFRKATLPEGWKREGSSHAMWSYIVDERGIERVGVFYKAAFYDRKADMHVTNVGYSLGRKALYSDGPDETPWDLLTDDERAEWFNAVDAYLKDAAEYPDIYKDGERAEQLRASRD